MAQIIEAKEQRLGDIFNDAYDFRIPPYQRPYAWTTEQTSALLDDLQTALNTGGNVKIEEMPPYFLGSIVVIKEREKAPSDVIDGQQRLTTLTILLCVLREIEEEPKRKIALHKRVNASGDPFVGTPDRFRLQLRERDKEFFRARVQTEGHLKKFLDESQNEKLTDSRKRIFENAQHLWTELFKLDQSKRHRLIEFLLQRCYLVVVSSSNLDSAYRVFAVMNDRGLDLSATDILKAEIIGELPEDNREAYTEKWEEIEEELGRDDFASLFAHIRMIYQKCKQQRTLIQEFLEGVLPQTKGEKFIDDVLVPLSESYQVVVKTGYESANDADKINRYLEYLRGLDNFDWVPPAIAFFARHKGDFDRLLQFTRDLERLAYVLFIRGADVNKRIIRYAKILLAIEKGDGLYEDTAPLPLKPEEKREVREILDGDIYNTWRTKSLRLLLLRLDSLLAGEGATYDHKTISVEHVLPQAPAGEWLKLFPDEQDRENWTHKLANLVLLSRKTNAKVQNHDFERKKTGYFSTEDGVSPFALTTQVLQQSEWTTDVLERRQRELLEKLAKEWRLD